MQTQRSALSLVAAGAGLLLAACSSSGTPSSGGTATQSSTAAPTGSLPFHYEAQGESSSPSFSVAQPGSYAVDYVLKGATQSPGCVVSINLVADDGSTQQVVGGVQLQPSDTRQDRATVTLGAGTWRFQEAGGCGWSVTVGAA
ncbi:MAG TPA: hypothetical protein VFC09_01225 [Candidatus Dormibacteraeota bacterium]|nr:hypothetical protein [Candidatus Dormibacteraeota bacterium]